MSLRVAVFAMTSFLAWDSVGAQAVTSSVQITVKNVAGRPLKRACVTFIPKEGDILFRNADAKGRVVLRNVAPGNYRIVVKVTGYQAQKRMVSVESGLESYEFALEPGPNE
jgi:hypothetical protein